jgi:Undecaprenyl-phosphate glucose phosphotransferase
MVPFIYLLAVRPKNREIGMPEETDQKSPPPKIAIAPDRRRANRREYFNPHLIRLLRREFALIATQMSGSQSGSTERRVSLIRWTHGLINRIVMVSDGVIILASGGLFWRSEPGHPSPLTWLQALTVALAMTVSFIWVMSQTRSYRVERYSRLWRPLFDLIRAFVPAVVVAIVILYAFAPELRADHQWFESWLLVIFVALVAGRQLHHLLVKVVERRNLLRRRVVVVGSGELTEAIVAELLSPPHATEYELISVVTPDLDKARPGVSGIATGPSSIAELTEYAQHYAVDLVVIALPWSRLAEMFAIIRQLQWIAADVVVPFEQIGFRPQFAPPVTFIDAPILQVMHRPFKGTQGLVKIFEDYLVAGIAIVLVSWVMLGAAIAVRLWGGDGPILFRQVRVGFSGKPFTIYKFRTMTVNAADDGSEGTRQGNPRITRVGSFLRRTSIDELPQLINVLRGEMSIVGPRPHVANMLVGEGVYADVVRQYAARHRIKPGITGWAQINGMRGGIDSLTKANRGADLDLYYVANWSFNFDIKIMLQTVFRGLAGSNVF